MTPREVVEQLPDLFQPEVAGKTKLTVQLDLTGDGGGQWWVAVAAGQCTVGAGPAAKPDLTLTVDAADYVRIRHGDLDPAAATMNGRMRVDGGYGKAVKFTKLFRPSR
jgi:putative sterol carrier protein